MTLTLFGVYLTKSNEVLFVPKTISQLPTVYAKMNFVDWLFKAHFKQIITFSNLCLPIITNYYTFKISE